ncbi:MAG: 2-keto-4-pentenoate hydratase [Pseudomonadota bacterium]
MKVSPNPVQEKKPDLEAISAAFCGARSAGRALGGFPGILPANLDDAYRVQDLSIARWPDQVAGWKVGGIDPAMRAAYPATRLCGPIFSRYVRHAADGEPVGMLAFEGGFAAIEAEFAFRLGDVCALPDAPLVLDDAIRAIESAHIGVEVASSPLATINELGPGAIVSDFGNNAGLVIGPALSRDRLDRLFEIEITVDIDGRTAGVGRAGRGADGPLGSVVFLIECLRQRGHAIPPGTWVSTGAISGVHSAPVGSFSVARFAGLGSLSVELLAHPRR